MVMLRTVNMKPIAWRLAFRNIQETNSRQNVGRKVSVFLNIQVRNSRQNVGGIGIQKKRRQDSGIKKKI